MLKDNWNQTKFILLSQKHHSHNIDHEGADLNLAKPQSKFGVPGARKVIKSVKEKCVIYRMIGKVVIGQEMG